MSKKKCFYCGFFNQEESLFCEKCGKKLEYICPNCGYVTYTATNFCVNCGDKFAFNHHSFNEGDSSIEKEENNDEESVSVSKEDKAIEDDSIEENVLETDTESENKFDDSRESIVCPSCGTRNDSSSLFCEGCGKRLIVDDEEKETESEETDSQVEVDSSEEEETVDESSEEVTSDEEEASDQEEEVLVCPSCGTRNELSSLFCEGCGKRLIVDDEEKETESEETDSQVEVDSSEEETVDESSDEVTSDEEEVSDQDEESEDEEESFDDSEEDEYVRICGYCQTENPLSSLFCIGCGRKLIDEENEESRQVDSESEEEVSNDDDEEEYVRVCGYCQTENPLSSLFCIGCGQKLLDEEEENETESEEETDSQVEVNSVEEKEETVDDSSEEVSSDQEIDSSIDEQTIDDDSVDEDMSQEEKFYEEKSSIDSDKEEKTTIDIEENENDDDSSREETIDQSSESKIPDEEEVVSEIEEDGIVCSACGTKNELSSVFCVGCGQKLIANDTLNIEAGANEKISEEMNVSKSEESVSSQEKKSKKKKLLLIILLFLLLIIAVGCYLFFCTDIFEQKKTEPDTEKKVELILVPNVVGEDIDVAKKKLEGLSLEVEIEEETTDNLDDVGKVFEQDVVDEEVEEGTIVTLKTYVSNEKVEMISVIESNVEEATKKLEELGLKVIVKEEYSEQAAGTIIKQNIPVNDEVSQGSVVEIVVSKGPEEETSQEGNKDSSSNNNSSNNSNSNSNSNNNNTNNNNNSNNNSSTNDSPVSSTESSWSEWVDTLPSNVNSSQYQIETKTQYRYQLKETTTSTSSTMSGWTLYDTRQEVVYSTEKTATVSGQSQLNTYKNNSNIVITSQECKLVTYGAYHCDKVESDGSYTITLPDQNLTCPSGYTLHRKGYNAVCSYINTSKESTTRTEHSHGEVHQSLIKNVTETDWTLTYKEKTGTQTTYYFYRYGAWSAWQDSVITANDSTNVDTRIMYRYRQK